MRVVIRNEDGSIGPADPIKPKGLFRLELWFRHHKINWLANLMARWDERGLG